MLRFGISDDFKAFKPGEPRAQGSADYGRNSRTPVIVAAPSPAQRLKRAALVLLLPLLGYAAHPASIASISAPSLIMSAQNKSPSSEMAGRLRRLGVDYTATGATCQEDGSGRCGRPSVAAPVRQHLFNAKAPAGVESAIGVIRPTK
jgi:hypothetical protein